MGRGEGEGEDNREAKGRGERGRVGGAIRELHHLAIPTFNTGDTNRHC
jgi:hypothetical protein